MPKRSTCSQMLNCNYDWRNALDSNNTVDVILIDFCKAFDLVSHKLLFNTLSSLGVCHCTLGWLDAFLCGRSQVVNINGATSSRGTDTSGVIQGCVIGPAFFVLYINNLPPSVLTVKSSSLPMMPRPIKSSEAPMTVVFYNRVLQLFVIGLISGC